MLPSKRTFLIAAMVVALATPLYAQIEKTLTQDNRLVLKTPAWRMVFNGERGGELNEVWLWDGDKFYRVNSTFAFKSLDTLPALSFTNTRDSYYSGKWDVFYANEGRGCKFEILKESPGEIHFKVSNKPRIMESGQVGPWIVTYTWHVYDVGVVFCDFEIVLPEKETFELAWSLMGMHVEDYSFKEKHQGKVAKFTWNWGMLDKTTDKGRWQPAVMSSQEAQPLDVDFKQDKDVDILGYWVPYGSATFNLDHLPETSYTNAMEVVFEDGRPLFTKDPANFGSHFKFRQSGLSPPPTWMGSDRNPPTFSFEWNLYHGPNVDLVGPIDYKNRFGLGFTTPRVTGNPSAHPVLKNRVQAARIYHWINAGKSGAAWYPSNADIDKMAAAGGDVLILGIGWKKPDPGVTGAATPGPASPEDLKRVADACHAKNIRLALTFDAGDLSVIERDTTWFTNYLKANSDGLYVLHPGFLYSPKNPQAPPLDIKGEDVKALGSSKDHVDAYAYFLLSKKLRGLVGANGFLIGETDPQLPTRIGMAYFDAYAPDMNFLAGETDSAVYARFRTGNGCVPRCPPARRPSRTVAFAAAYGDAPQVLLGAKAGDPVDPGDAQNMAFANLWKIYRAANLADATVHNTVSRADKVYTLDTGNVRGTLYRVSDDEMMLVLANLGPSTPAKVKLDFAKLAMKPGNFAARVMKIGADGEYADLPAVTAKDGVFDTGEMGRFDVLAFHLKRQ
jgi:hypothetical protein